MVKTNKNSENEKQKHNKHIANKTQTIHNQTTQIINANKKKQPKETTKHNITKMKNET